MYQPPKKQIVAKQFRLPLEQGVLNQALNSPDIVILDKRVFTDKTGDVTVYLEYEKYTLVGEEEELEPTLEEDELFD